MKAVHVLVAVIALVVGIAVGGLGPRAEVRALRAQLDAAGECASPAIGSDIANVFRGRPWEEGRPPPDRRVTKIAPPDAGPTPVDTDVAEPEPSSPEAFTVKWGDGEGGDLPNKEEGLAMAREAMELRYAQARAALLEDASPSDAQLAEIDATMAAMNDQLVGLARDLVAEVAEGGEPSRRDAMLYAAETLDVLLTAEESLRGSLSAEQIAALQDESLDPLSYVDPAIVDVLAELDRP